jgi:uncharacterized protein (TIGR00375 family)
MEKMSGDWMISDLHLHSRFSRACSKDLTLDNLVKWAKIKGLNLLGTGDFTHPIWFKEIKEKLKSNGKGFYLHNETGFPFIITGEISLIYSKNGKGRKVHLVTLVPSVEIAEKINAYLDTKGRRDYDGRPIFGISCEDFTRDLKNIDDNIEIIPAHIWTPYFGVFGSMSGFDSLKEAFEGQINKIHAIETGISSDPKMNLKIKEIVDRKISIVSFSDSHSFWPWRLGREATIFKKTDSYTELIRQIRENDFIGTIETDPAYGKYHWDGHAACGFSCGPEKTKKLNGTCPKCGKKLIIGVENRVEKLAENGIKHEREQFFPSILPLHEIIALNYGVSENSKKVWTVYNELIEKFGNEFNILLNVSRTDLINSGTDFKLAELIIKNREGKIKVKPGYDGEYGKAILEIKTGESVQKKLF